MLKKAVEYYLSAQKAGVDPVEYLKQIIDLEMGPQSAKEKK
jgi:hypothetical protein